MEVIEELWDVHQLLSVLLVSCPIVPQLFTVSLIIMNKCALPFEVGQMAEARSFQAGFRGAWFRCKIMEIGWRSQLGYSLEYFDFPDEKITWTKVYQRPPTSGHQSKELQLMVRPPFPPIYRESQMADLHKIEEVVVIVADVWKVGDLVDWWSDDCYWSARVTEILGDEKVQIELLPPPVGEGLSYEAFCKDLRPSLDWSPECGWKIPLESECARLINPLNLGGLPNLTDAVDKERKVDKVVTTAVSRGCSDSFSSHTSASSLLPRDGSNQIMNLPSETMNFNANDSILEKTRCSDSVSSSHLEDTSAQKAVTTREKDVHFDGGALKKMRTEGNIPQNYMSSDTIEASILDLEELLNRVKWLKRLLEFEMPSSNTLRPSWKFVEDLVTNIPE